MNFKIFLPYLLVMAIVTYLIRAIPLVLVKHKIKNKFFNSFLYYIILRLWEICKSFFQILILLLYPKTASKAQPSGNEIILICGLRASIGYKRAEQVFNTPRLKSQIRIFSFSKSCALAVGANQIITKL